MITKIKVVSELEKITQDYYEIRELIYKMGSLTPAQEKKVEKIFIDLKALQTKVIKNVQTVEKRNRKLRESNRRKRNL